MRNPRTIRAAAAAAIVALTFEFAMSGCGVSDKHQIQAAVTTWKEGASSKDVSKLMSIVSDHFAHDGHGYKAGNTAELRDYFVRSIQQGGLDGVDVVVSDMKIDIKDTKATVYPIKWKTPKTSTMLELTFTKETAGWRMTDMGIGTKDERKGAPKNAAETMARFDNNHDGKISKDEMPEFLRGRATLIDVNGDGGLTEEELDAAFRRMRPR